MEALTLSRLLREYLASDWAWSSRALAASIVCERGPAFSSASRLASSSRRAAAWAMSSARAGRQFVVVGLSGRQFGRGPGALLLEVERLQTR